MSYNPELDVYEGYLYLITNIKNNYKYVGQTRRDVETRWQEHIKENKTHFDNVVSNYGFENFKVEVIEKHSDDDLYCLKSILNDRERYYIKKYNSLVPGYGGHGYNVDEGGWSMNFFGKPVDVYNMEGELVASYSSRIEVAEKYGTDPQYVGNICNGKIPNYRCICVFRDKGDSFLKYNIVSKYYREIYQFTLDGYCIGKYYTSNQVKQKYGITFLHEIIDQPYRIGGGYWWGSTNEFGYIGEEKKGTLKITTYDLFGNVINKFESLEKCRLFYGCSQDSILNNCNGLTATLNGMIFRYDNDPYDKYIEKFKDEILKEIMFTEYPVYQYDLYCKLVGVYNSIRDAITYIKKHEPENKTVEPTTVLKCCLGERSICGGYFWSYEKYDLDANNIFKKEIEKFPNDNHRGLLKRPIDVYSLEYKYITTFHTRLEIKNFLGRSKTGEISKCLLKTDKASSAYGYIWCYNGEEPDRNIKHILKVDQYTMDGIFIKTYNNASDAERNNPGIYSSSIGKCCIGALKQSGNFVWRYNGHPFDEFGVSSKSTNCKPLSCYTKDGIFVKYFSSVKDAAKFINKKRPTISANLSGKAKTAGGYCFYYANDPNQPDKTKITNTKEFINNQAAQNNAEVDENV